MLDPSLLLGLHGSRHRGDGSEFDDIREYRPGDRPRRIHWRTSARTGRLHVRTTYADNDTEVVLLVDAFGNLPGSPDGSLTRTVRAAASIAAWCTRNGDRVGLRYYCGNSLFGSRPFHSRFSRTVRSPVGC